MCVGSESAACDENYYFHDGSCIVLAEDTLFNVHRSILSRDSSSFPMPSIQSQNEQFPVGTSDDNPIVLCGDTAREFRHFLWALYSMPHEVKDLHRTRKNVPKLLDIANISIKYSFKSLEIWACDTLKSCIARRPFPLRESKPAERAQLIDIIHLAQLCQHKRLLDALISSFQELLTLSPGYNELRGPEFWDTPEMRAAPYQRLSILNGYYHLTSLWEFYCKNPPKYSHSSTCLPSVHPTCEARWHAFRRGHIVSDNVLSLNPADVTGRLKAIAKSSSNDFKWGCDKQAAETLLKEIPIVERDYFQSLLSSVTSPSQPAQ